MNSPDSTGPRFRRVVLKLSGESFSPAGERGITMEEVIEISKQIVKAQELGCEVAVVIGGGNIFRGLKASAQGMDRATADYMGMLATVMNAINIRAASPIQSPPFNSFLD